MAELAEILCARLCHDLAGPLGTLAGALELAVEGDTEALELAQHEAARAAARLRFLRAAWSGGVGALDAAGLAALAAGLPGVERLEADFSGVLGKLPEALARLALCTLPLALLAQPRRGRVRFQGDALGLVAELAAGAWPALQAAPDARNVASAMLHGAAREAGYTIATDAARLTLRGETAQATRR